jgi:hypothetical protein
MRFLRIVGSTIGFMVLAFNAAFLYLDLRDRRSPVIPLACMLVATCLIWIGRKSQTMPKGIYERTQAYLNRTPSARRLQLLADILGWCAVPLITASSWFVIARLPQLGPGGIFAVAFLSLLPSLVLNAIVLRGYVADARARTANRETFNHE